MNKTSIASVIISILAIAVAVVSFGIKTHPSTNVGSVTNTDLYQYPYGVSIGQANGPMQPLFYQSVALPILSGQSQAAWLNNTGYEVFVRNYVGELIGTSTTAQSGGKFTFSVGTSTPSGTSCAVSDTAPPTGTLINAATLATGTPVTGTVFNSDVSGGSAAQGVIAVPNNTCVYSALETATGGSTVSSSTARGFNVYGYIEYTDQGLQ